MYVFMVKECVYSRGKNKKISTQMNVQGETRKDFYTDEMTYFLNGGATPIIPLIYSFICVEIFSCLYTIATTLI